MAQRNGGARYPRTARVNELVREIVAEELARIDDTRLELVAVTQVAVDRDLERAMVYFDVLGGADDDEVVLGVLAEHRARLQGAIGRQARLRRTPQLQFQADDVARGAARIESIIRGFHDEEG
jgi:ribosome-binding factor A